MKKWTTYTEKWNIYKVRIYFNCIFHIYHITRSLNCVLLTLVFFLEQSSQSEDFVKRNRNGDIESLTGYAMDVLKKLQTGISYLVRLYSCCSLIFICLHIEIRINSNKLQSCLQKLKIIL